MRIWRGRLLPTTQSAFRSKTCNRTMAARVPTIFSFEQSHDDPTNQKRPNSACYLHLCATSLVLLSETEAVGMDPASAHRNDCNGCHPVCNAASHRANLPMKSTQHLSMNRQSKLENLAVARHTCHHPPPPTMTMTIVHSKAHHTSSRASAQILGVPRFFQH